MVGASADGSGKQGSESAVIETSLVSQIEAMAKPLGRGLYRGLLKRVARVWNPGQIKDGAVLKKVLDHMQAAERGLRRLETALDKVGLEALVPMWQSFGFHSIEQIEDLKTLHQIVVAIEAKAGLANTPQETH
jgi:hypothetical protein